jgi:Domain of unknown function (DUF5667)
MPRPKPNKLHDDLDALLDGRPVELTDELVPLAEAADALRAELAAYQLDPRVADRHLERLLHGSGSASVVPLPVPGQPSGWDLRRRVAAVVLAAALVLAPATMASAAALPGQPMYPFKRAIEEIRVAAVQWSPSREAVVRTRVADERLVELNRLFELKIFTQVPRALTALSEAVQEAEAAVDDATREGEPVPVAVASKLDSVKAAGGVAVAVAKAVAGQLPSGTRNAINAAVVETQDVLVPDPGSGGPPVTTPIPGSPPASAGPAGPSPPPASQPQPPNSTPEVPTTTEPPVTTTTAPPTTTTAPEPATTESTVTQGSAGGGDTGGDQTGADG